MPLNCVAIFPLRIFRNDSQTKFTTGGDCGGWLADDEKLRRRWMTDKLLLVAAVSVLPATESVYPPPTLFKFKPVKIAIPSVAEAIFVPPSVLPAKLFA